LGALALNVWLWLETGGWLQSSSRYEIMISPARSVQDSAWRIILSLRSFWSKAVLAPLYAVSARERSTRFMFAWNGRSAGTWGLIAHAATNWLPTRVGGLVPQPKSFERY